MTPLHPFRLSGSPESAASEVVDWAKSLLGGDLACWYDVRSVGTGWVINDARVNGSKNVVDVWMRDLGLSPASRDLSPDLPPTREVNRVLDIETSMGEVGGARHATYLRHYLPFGFCGHRRVLIYDGRRFLGWFGVLRTEDNRRFTRKDTQTLTRALPLIRGALRVHSAGPDLSARGTNACVFSQSGVLEYRTPGVQRWLTDQRRHRLGEAVRRRAHPEDMVVVYIDRSEATISPLEGAGGRNTSYLVALAATDPALLDRRHELSPRQREVTTLAAAGATAIEIAQMLGLSPHTIRDHLKTIYRVLNVSSRAELGQVWRNFEG